MGLLARVDGLAGGVRGVHGALAGRMAAAGGSGSLAAAASRHDVSTPTFASLPLLQYFRVDVCATVEQAACVLRNEAPFEALQMRALRVSAEVMAAEEAAVLDLATAVPVHASLRDLQLVELPLQEPAVLDAICAASLALRTVALMSCDLEPASVPALVRLISGGPNLLDFAIADNDAQLFDAAGGAALAAALAASRLTHLMLSKVDFWHDAGAGVAVVQALTGHPTLQSLNLGGNVPADEGAAGGALGALVAANAPALTALDVASSLFGDFGMVPIMEALPRNTHLRDLRCTNSNMSDDFAREHFLPAVLANTSLRKLKASFYWDNEPDGVPPPEVLEAEALVRARRRGERRADAT